MTEAMTELALFEALALDCRVDEYGTVRYYNALGQMHRVYGPAVEYADGEKVWCQNGLRHRVDGPAIEYPDGTYEWWLNGRRLSQAQWRQEVTNMETV
jgi:hypothetical protein